MALPLALGWDQISSILSLYHLDGLEAFGDLSNEAQRSLYWVQVSGRRYLLRICAKRRFSDLVFEKDLMKHLHSAGLDVPRVVENVASGAFTPWESRGRYVSLFEDLGGRPLGVFEIRARHVRAVASFLADLHDASEQFPGHRKNAVDVELLDKKLSRLERAVTARRLPRRFHEDVALLAREMRAQRGRRPTGQQVVAHAGMSVRSVRFSNNQLVGVIDFVQACRERATWDLAGAIHAWCWEPAHEQQGGPSGRFSRRKVQAMISEYSRRRPLSARAMGELRRDVRLVAAGEAILRLVNHELRSSNQGAYEDYRHYAARLRAARDDDAKQLFS